MNKASNAVFDMPSGKGNGGQERLKLGKLGYHRIPRLLLIQNPCIRYGNFREIRVLRSTLQ